MSITALIDESESPDNETPDEAFDRAWKVSVLQTVRRNLEAHSTEASDPEERCRFEIFAALHFEDRAECRPTQEALAERFGLTCDQVRYADEQVRKRFERFLRQEIRDQMGATVDIEETRQFTRIGGG